MKNQNKNATSAFLEAARRDDLVSSDVPNDEHDSLSGILCPPEYRLCRYYKDGCHIFNCAFSHDPSTVTCKYIFSPTGCTDVDCIFSHPFLLPGEESPSSSVEDELFWFFENSDDHRFDEMYASFDNFPSFEDSSGNKTIHGSLKSGDSSPKHEFTLDPKVNLLKRIFPEAPESDIQAYYDNVDRNVDDVLAVLDVMYTRASNSAMYLNWLKSNLPSYSEVAKLTPTPVSKTKDSPTHYIPVGQLHERNASRYVNEIKRKLKSVDSFNELQELYRNSRASANDYGQQREYWYEEATFAYRNGDRHLAKYYSCLVRKFDALMRESNNEASEIIFQKRNPVSEGSVLHAFDIITFEKYIDNCVDLRVPICDLHGQHPEEAFNIVCRVMVQCWQGSTPAAKKKGLWAAFITGAGVHSKKDKKKGYLLNSLVEQLKLNNICCEYYCDREEGILILNQQF